MRQIPNYPNYFITKRGTLYSLTVPGFEGQLIKLDVVIAQGRKHKNLYNEQGHKHFTIAQLVALTYIPNPNNYPLVMHKDNDTLNDYYKNLEWGTQKMNLEQMARDGRGFNGKPFSSLEFCMKVLEIKRVEKLSNRAIARRFKLTHRTINEIINGVSYNAREALKLTNPQ